MNKIPKKSILEYTISPTSADSDVLEPVKKMRVQKYLSQHGVASRRKAEDFIVSKQVQINGRIAQLGDTVNPRTDVIKVYGKVIKPVAQPLYIALYKPLKTVVSRRDPQGRATVFNLLPTEYRSIVHNVGRLDYDSEGLLLFTNDGSLTQQLTHPSHAHEKEYEVGLNENPTESQLDKIRRGVELPSGVTEPAKIKIKNGFVYITIREGKKHQVRRMFNAVGLSVVHLKRIRMGKFILLKNLKPGEFVNLIKSDII